MLFVGRRFPLFFILSVVIYRDSVTAYCGTRIHILELIFKKRESPILLVNFQIKLRRHFAVKPNFYKASKNNYSHAAELFFLALLS